MTSTMPPARILAFDDIDSTNAEARRLAEGGERGPLWITALRQHAGRGRRGRSWETGEGNLAATYLFVTGRPAAEAAQMSFVAALAVADLLEAYGPDQPVRLKWPNDPMIGARKAAGILLESAAAEAGGLWLAVGCGVNLARPPAQAERPAASLAEHLSGPPPSPQEAVRRLATAMDAWRGVWERQGFAAIARAWTERAYGLGEVCQARLPAETVEGVAEGLEADGALRLRLADGAIRRITAGDVFF